MDFAASNTAPKAAGLAGCVVPKPVDFAASNPAPKTAGAGFTGSPPKPVVFTVSAAGFPEVDWVVPKPVTFGASNPAPKTAGLAGAAPKGLPGCDLTTDAGDVVAAAGVAKDLKGDAGCGGMPVVDTEVDAAFGCVLTSVAAPVVEKGETCCGADAGTPNAALKADGA